jgi:hypothetical protein
MYDIICYEGIRMSVARGISLREVLQLLSKKRTRKIITITKLPDLKTGTWIWEITYSKE